MFYMCCFLFNDAPATEIYTYEHHLSLHDALPICRARRQCVGNRLESGVADRCGGACDLFGLTDGALRPPHKGVGGTPMSHLTQSHSDLLARRRRLAGPVGAVRRPLLAAKDCAQLLRLVAAVRGAATGGPSSWERVGHAGSNSGG